MSAILLALLGVVAWKGTPEAHNLLAQREYEEIVAGTLDPSQLEDRLRLFVEDTRPYGWYVLVFKHGYTIGAVGEAQHALDSSQKSTSIPVIAPENLDVRALESAVGDSSVPWPEIADRAGAMLRSASGLDKIRIQAVLDRAQTATRKMDTALRQIQESLAAGAESDALALATNFRAQQERAGKLLAQLPLPGRVSALTEDGQQITPDAAPAAHAASRCPPAPWSSPAARIAMSNSTSAPAATPPSV